MLLISYPPKDPSETLDYAMDFTAQMTADNDTVTTLIGVTAKPTGLTIANPTLVGSKVICWISGGTLLADYLITFEVTTAGGRTYSRSAYLPVKTR